MSGVMYIDAWLHHAPRCASRAGSSFPRLSSQNLQRPCYHVRKSFSNLSHAPFTGAAVTSPFISQCHKFRAEYDQAVSLSTRVLQLGTSELEYERIRVSREFENSNPSVDRENWLEHSIKNFRERITSQVFTDNTKLNAAAKYVLSAKSKLFRPRLGLMVARLLYARITTEGAYQATGADSNNLSSLSGSDAIMSGDLLERIMRLLQSYEIVHVGSLVHDDILDNAKTRRGLPTVHVKMGTKIATLVGDLMLTRACSTVAKLGSQQLTLRMAKALENLIKGELMQVEGTDTADVMLCDYLKKIFLKTASPIAECCASIADLLRQDESVRHRCYLIGLHVGMAFQIYDDLLDYRSSSTDLGKPTLNDLSSGLITMPLLMALPESPELESLLTDGTVSAGKVDIVLPFVNSSHAFARSQCAVMMHLAEVSRLLRCLDSKEAAPESPLSESAQTLLRFIYDTLTRSTG
ncbi:putative solanesyl-diphosphate synthase [Babesia sp. Xinjiang]|uniref:putative solanesyl-diphosphate synthase n=1 Tax=Babesia sp. Xinjiang TaxID=462227 RepID=UPI000A2264A5|nr:putative solanesyl-diphosphate synthase [Babesia sp. Xinjiang]ORM40333.1 putative solanesyl-diphosphate synthase [Babesia sp. Xinjiang]